MDLSTLKKLGLDDKEIKVYFTLLNLGEITTGPLVKNTNIPSSKIYYILDKLVQKGLVGYFLQGGVKKFRANRPNAIRHLLDLKEQELVKTKFDLDQIIPQLKQLYSKEKEEYSVELLEGLRGVKSVYDLSLELTTSNETFYTIGYPLLASQLLNAYFKDFHIKMTKKKVHSKILYDYDTWFGKKREPRPYAEQRYLPKNIKTPAFIHIFKEYVAIMVVTEQQKLSILIKNKEVADSYLHYFNLLWKLGKSTKK
ncbi:MAG: helix-turn-helix domain-containing protein [Candidatus Micrarchaeota archaeon]